MKIKSILFRICLITILTSTNFTDVNAQNTKPSIIYILADDLGYGDLGCYGQQKIKTPNLDKMAAEGIMFTNHYSGQTVCSPSRCALMTGYHMGNASVVQNGQLLDPDDVTVSELLKDAGYATAAIGKWGLAQGPSAPNSAKQKGFDLWFGFDNQGFAHFYYPEYLWRNHDKVEYPENIDIRDDNEHYIEGAGTYSHDEFTKEALSFIQENKDTTFFLYLPFAIPHAELTVPADSREQYDELGWPETPKTEAGYIGSNMADQGYGSQYTAGYCTQVKPNVTYAGMISRMDNSIGKILDLLKELNLDENTIVMFASDNGPSSEGGQDLEFFNSTGGLRGKKGTVYEEGIRIPFIARWPGKIEAGTLSDLPSAFWDFLPTACDIAGANIPENTDGISFLPTLLGNNDIQKKHDYMYWEWKGIQVITSGEWKLMYMNATKPKEKPIYELYNLEEDIAEENNVEEQNPEIVKKLLSFLNPIVEVESVNINEDSISIIVGGFFNLNAEITPGNSTINTVTWFSGDNSIATINETLGKVKAIAKGETYMVVKTNDGGYTDTCKVIVNDTATITDLSNLFFKDDLVYPNPFSTELNIEINSSVSKVSLYDASGKLVLEKHLNSRDKISLSPSYANVPVGSYILQLSGKSNFRAYKIIREYL